MEKLKIVIILLGLIWFSGCGYIKQTNIESKDIAFSEEETTSIQSDYENYIGTWSEEGKSHESIIYEGGTEFSVEITSDNELNGYLYSQQEISGRFAEIDIICRIEDGECYYPFSDDGWGNSGILYIQFETNVIKISVQDFVMGESNTSGFGIDRTYILSKEEANQNSTEYDGEQKEQLLQYSVDWSEDQILDEIEKRAVYLNRCSYYEEVLDFIKTFDATEEEMTKYIIGAVGSVVIPRTPRMEGAFDLTSYLNNVTDEDYAKELEEIINCTAEDIRSLYDLVKSVLDDKALCVIGNENKIEEQKDLFNNIFSLIN